MTPAEAAELAQHAKGLWPRTTVELRDRLAAKLLTFPDPAYTRGVLDRAVERADDHLPYAAICERLESELRRRGLTSEARSRMAGFTEDKKWRGYWRDAFEFVDALGDDALDAMLGPALAGLPPDVAALYRRGNPRTHKGLVGAIFDYCRSGEAAALQPPAAATFAAPVAADLDFEGEAAGAP